jgi:CDGSH-type Zn-finger protein
MADVTVSIRPNGPYLVSGTIVLLDENGNPIDLEGREKFALCRCGGSVNKPFCDGTHSKIGFIGATRAVAEAERGKS